MYTLNAKKRGWIDVVHLVIWGPSAKLLVENEELQNEVKAMQEAGVVVEACVACANNYGVADELRALDIDVKGVTWTNSVRHWGQMRWLCHRRRRLLGRQRLWCSQNSLSYLSCAFRRGCAVETKLPSLTQRQ